MARPIARRNIVERLDDGNVGTARLFEEYLRLAACDLYAFVHVALLASVRGSGKAGNARSVSANARARSGESPTWSVGSSNIRISAGSR